MADEVNDYEAPKLTVCDAETSEREFLRALLTKAEEIGDRSLIEQVVTLCQKTLEEEAARLLALFPPALPAPLAWVTINLTFEDVDPDAAFKKFKADLWAHVDRAIMAAEPGQPVKAIDAAAFSRAPGALPPDRVAKGQRWRLGQDGSPHSFAFTLVERAVRDDGRVVGWKIADCTAPHHNYAYDLWWDHQTMTLLQDAPAEAPPAPVIQPCSACGETPPEGRTHWCPLPMEAPYLSDGVLRAYVIGRAEETGVKPCCVIGGISRLRRLACPFHDPKPEAPAPWMPEDDGFGYRGT